MKWKNKYTARTLGLLVFIPFFLFVLVCETIIAIKRAIRTVYIEMVDLTKRALIDNWKSWDDPEDKL